MSQLSSNATKGSYWLTREGLLERTKMFSKRAVYGLYNETTKAGAKAYGARWLIYRNGESETGPCPECESFADRRYNMGQFVPYIPRAHPGCVCYWDYEWDLSKDE